MTKPLACHYSVVRFAPYPETDEFVNVGVVLACPTVGYLDFRRADLRRRGRVGKFFPELDPNVYSAAMLAWVDSLKAYRNVPDDGQTLDRLDRERLREVFKVIVRPRESILYYSEPRVILSDNPAATLDDVFGAYVERRFANVPEYQERVMCRRLEGVLKDADLLQRYELSKIVGDERYHITFPFVRTAAPGARPIQAIKALHLDRDEPTDILHHSDAWRSHVGRLRNFGTAPEELLFVLQGPQNRAAAHNRAFDDVREDLDRDRIPFVDVDAVGDILAFAKHVT